MAQQAEDLRVGELERDAVHGPVRPEGLREAPHVDARPEARRPRVELGLGVGVVLVLLRGEHRVRVLFAHVRAPRLLAPEAVGRGQERKVPLLRRALGREDLGEVPRHQGVEHDVEEEHAVDAAGPRVARPRAPAGFRDTVEGRVLAPHLNLAEIVAALVRERRERSARREARVVEVVVHALTIILAEATVGVPVDGHEFGTEHRFALRPALGAGVRADLEVELGPAPAGRAGPRRRRRRRVAERAAEHAGLVFGPVRRIVRAQVVGVGATAPVVVAVVAVSVDIAARRGAAVGARRVRADLAVVVVVVRAVVRVVEAPPALAHLIRPVFLVEASPALVVASFPILLLLWCFARLSGI